MGEFLGAGSGTGLGVAAVSRNDSTPALRVNQGSVRYFKSPSLGVSIFPSSCLALRVSVPVVPSKPGNAGRGKGPDFKGVLNGIKRQESGHVAYHLHKRCG